MRAVALSLFVGLAVGCAAFERPKPVLSFRAATRSVPRPEPAPLCSGPDGELQHTFVAGVLEMANAKGSQRLAELRATHANDVWGARAGVVEAAFAACGIRDRRIAELENQLDGATNQRDILQAEVDRLRRGLEELKRLTIEMERRAN